MESAKLVAAMMFLLFLLFLVVMGPIFTIWSLNSLFALSIPINFETWCATLWIVTVFHGIKLSVKKQS